MKVAAVPINARGINSMDEIKRCIDHGAKFIIYQYTISAFLITIKRVSSAVLVMNEFEHRKNVVKFNAITCLFGWWSLPMGPVASIRTILANRKGGIDYTDEVLLNLSDECLMMGEIQIIQSNLLFEHPIRSDRRALRKALLKLYDREYSMKKIVVAVSLTKRSERGPLFVVGFLTSQEKASVIQDMQKALYKHFFRHVSFEFIDMSEETKESLLIAKQGVTLIER